MGDDPGLILGTLFFGFCLLCGVVCAIDGILYHLFGIAIL